MLVGMRQIFLRFHACNIDCAYCDTERNVFPEFCTMEGVPGRRNFNRVRNPIGLDRILALLDNWVNGWPGIHHSLSLTGGEPLLHHETLGGWLPLLKKRFPIYLETNGMLHRALADLIDFIDYVSMDIKLPSTSGHSELWDQHHEFLKIAARKNVFVKTVVNDMTEDWEIIKTAAIITSVNKDIPLILQPITLPSGGVGISPLKTLEFQEVASRYLTEVRVIPQTHKFLGQL